MFFTLSALFSYFGEVKLEILAVKGHVSLTLPLPSPLVPTPLTGGGGGGGGTELPGISKSFVSRRPPNPQSS